MSKLFRRFFPLGVILLALHSCSGGERPLTILVPVAPRTLDPYFATTTVELSLLMNIFEALVVRRDDMTLGPGLAERWEIDKSRKVWTFHLRRGVEFTNGEPFGAEAVKYTFGRMVSGRLRPRITVPNRISLGRVEIVDGHTVRIHTKSPATTLPVWPTNAFILALGHYSSKTRVGEVSRKPVGTGPYKVSEWDGSGPVRMEANGKWWRGKPKIREAIWRSVPESSGRIEELDAGTADIITNIPPVQGLMLVRERRGSQFKTVRGYEAALMFTQTDPELYYLQSLVYVAQWKFDEALASVNKALKLNTTFQEAQRAREKILAWVKAAKEKEEKMAAVAT
jgi:peptide/nickel transport system substrate-binding protein